MESTAPDEAGTSTRTALPGDDAATTSGTPAPCTSGSTLIDGVVWIDVDGRPSLEVTPSALLRRCGLAGVDDTAWAEVVALEPDAQTPGMADQLTCHILFAPTKDVWHLEPWRPVVDTPELVQSRCNPGGADPDLPQF
nr:DUF2599 domain-containing protein [Ornithinimicrobium sp. F0845]